MHPYATDSGERIKVALAIGVISLPLAYFLAGLLHWAELKTGITLSVFDIPGAYGIAAALYALFDHWLWRLGVFRKLRLVRIPYLGGAWEGEGVSSHQDTQFSVTATIEQTWSHISVRFEMEGSRSYSVVAGLLVGSAAGSLLTYEYWNEPKPGAMETMHAHRGVAHFPLPRGGPIDTLEGEYYSGRDRMNQGELRLRRRRSAMGSRQSNHQE